jgi:N-acetylmuramoyl-L-alanine amidase
MNRRRHRRALTAALTVAVLCAAALSARAAAGVLRFDGKEIPLDAAYAADGATFLPAEAALTRLGASVLWQAETRRLTVRWGDRLAALDPFTNAALVNGQIVTLSAPPRFLAGRLCLPVDFFTRALPLLTEKPLELADLQPVAPPAVTPRLFFDLGPGRRRMMNLHRLVLDAGHGGHDLGARSPQGFCEKDVNLALTVKLADLLGRTTDLEVILTRRDDTFIPLPERTRVANARAADLFISLHANGAYRRSATGFEVYFLSLQSSDDRAARLAAAENAGVGAPTPDKPGESEDDVNSILRDLVRTENLAASERLAIALQARLDLAMSIENRGVKQAPFFVLGGAQAPAALIEVGFMSNPEEAELLRRPDTQDRIVNALFNAILYYDAVAAPAGASE